MFFGSDDIMDKNMVEEMINGLNSYSCFKPRYVDFRDGEKINLNSKHFIGEGVFGVKKSIFEQMNGFEPWMCAADSDFMGRFYKQKYRLKVSNKLNFYRRIHNQGLTSRKDTGMSSQLRANYAKISKNKKGDGNPSILHTRPFELVTTETFTITKEYDYQREIRNQKLDMIFNKTIRKSVEVPQHKKPDPVILDRFDFLYNNKTEEPRIIKTNKPNNRQELIDKKNGTTKNTIKELFSVKPNHREGKNFIHLGGKFN